MAEPTNVDVQAMIDQFGDRIYAIYFDNDRVILVNYKNSPKMSDIKLVTIGGVDYVAVHHTNLKPMNTPVACTNYHVTATIQWIGVMDDESAEYRVDPLLFR